MVNALVAYTLTPNIPHMDTNYIQAEATAVGAYLELTISNETNSAFTKMIVR